jgi:LPPG:FO 2-phospho-L-lactate transferase
MRVTVLAGGYGGARFLVGLRRRLGTDATITAVVNTADDIVLHGLSISPDLDTVMYTLGGGLDTERGWGRTDEAFRVNEELQAHGVPSTWFGLGDRDLATHLIRTQMLTAGYRLTDVTVALATRWQPGVTLLPMTDDRVETHVIVSDSDGRRAIHFQEWWIRYRAQLTAEQFLQVGADTAHATPEVLAAIADADAVILAPSNPVVSIGAMLSLTDLADAVRTTPAPVVGVSPIIAGRAIRGMAEQCLAAIGVPATAAGVAIHYGSRADGGLLDGWLVAPEDEAAVALLDAQEIRAEAVPLLLSDPTASAQLADAALRLAGRCRR